MTAAKIISYNLQILSKPIKKKFDLLSKFGLITRKKSNLLLEQERNRLNNIYKERIKALTPKEHSKGYNYTIRKMGTDLFGYQIIDYFMSDGLKHGECMNSEIKTYSLKMEEQKMNGPGKKKCR